MKPINKALFLISVDVELLWGFVSYPKSKMVSLLANDPSKGRKGVESLLRVLDKYNIPATWAIVGHLLIDHCSKSSCLTYTNSSYFQYRISDPGSDIQTAPLFYGTDIVDMIRSSRVKHEIGYHSFSHIIFPDCSREIAEAEVAEGVKLANELGITLKSFVYPRNRIGYTDILKEYGFKAYRGSLAYKDRSKSALARIANLLVTRFIALPGELQQKDSMWEVPNSMFFSPLPFSFTLLPGAKFGVLKAIREKKVFHIFLHPENLLAHPSLEKKLDKLLAFVTSKKSQGEIEVATMGELALSLERLHKGVSGG